MLDDISFDNCAEGDIPEGSDHLSCDFETDTCSWYHDYTASLLWKRTNGVFTDLNGNGRPSNEPNRSSSLMEPTPLHGECLIFWYYMEGTGVGELSVYLQPIDSQQNSTKLWTRIGDQGSHWRHGRVTLYSPQSSYQVATLSSKSCALKIDDFSVRDGTCAPPASCDFESGQCTWVNVEKEGGHEWVLSRGGSHGPPTDHTTQTSDGKPLVIQPFLSSIIIALCSGKGSCVQLWYHMYGEGMGTLNVYQQSEDGQEILIFSQAGDQGRLWRLAQETSYNINTTQRFIVHIYIYMAFDDVQLTDAQCPPHGVCDFENSFCSWTNLGDGADQGDWLLGAGASPNPNTGPTVDHTTNSSSGTLLLNDCTSRTSSMWCDTDGKYNGPYHFFLQVTTYMWTAQWVSGETCPTSSVTSSSHPQEDTVLHFGTTCMAAMLGLLTSTSVTGLRKSTSSRILVVVVVAVVSVVVSVVVVSEVVIVVVSVISVEEAVASVVVVAEV
uniref:MAM and LDL-receptor class A domain-containing protein 1-like n=1 Tax=Fundulus heteroclitus TaxID=8078 RepID=A0A3Q2NV61_FUNHE